MYFDLWEVYLCNGMENDIAKFVAKCPNSQQFKVELQRSGSFPKYKYYHLELVRCKYGFYCGFASHPKATCFYLGHYRSNNKISNFISVKVSHSTEDCAKLYISDIVKFFGSLYLLFGIGVLKLHKTF